MEKLVFMRLTGNLSQQGYVATLEIGEEGRPPYAEASGRLPAYPDLEKKITNHWNETYRNLMAPYRRKDWPIDEISARISPIKISYDGSVNDRIRECKESADGLRKMFLQWLDVDEFRAIDRCLRLHVNPGEVSRFLIRTEDRLLQKLPWHAWDVCEKFETEPSFGTSRRQPSQQLKTSTNNQSVKILAILGHSDGIDVNADRQLLEKLAPGTQFLVEPTRREITDHLWEQAWDIIFFAGHSETEGDTGKIYISPTEYLTIDELWYGLRKAVKNGLQVAIFNSCDGLGLAQGLTNDFQIPNLIVMRELVPDEVAQEFLKYFLSAFQGGRPFHLAVKEARERLQGLEGRFPCASWLPTIYQNPLEAALYWKDLTMPSEEQGEAETEFGSRNEDPNLKSDPPRSTWKSIRQTTTIGLLLAICVIGIRWSRVLEPMELLAFDYLMRSRPMEPLDPNILLVEATPEEAENVEEYGYPISDGKLAELLEKLQANEPVAIGLMSQRRQQRGTDEERAVLINQFNANPNLVTMCSVNEGTDELHGAPEEFSQEQQQQQVGFGNFYVSSSLLGESVHRQLLSYKPQALDHASPCITHSSFGLHLAYQFLLEAGIEGFFSDQKELQFNDVTLHKLPRRFGGYQSLDGYSNQIILNYRSGQHKPAMTVTVDDVFSGKVKPSFIKDRIVIVGTNNPHVVNYFNTPYGEMPPLYIQGHMVSNLIQAVLNRRSLIWALPQWGDYLLISLATFLGCGVFLILKFPLKIGLASGIFVWGWHQACLVILSQGGWMPFIPVLLAFLLSAWGAYLINVYPRLTNHQHK